MTTILPAALSILCGIVTIIWTTRHVLIWREHRRNNLLTPESPPAANRPHVSVFVAAKDEEANIADCVTTMLQQDYGAFDVTVIDDRSTDRTAEIVEDLCRRDDRLHLLRVNHLPDGWCGKCHAMWTGTATTTSPWIVMTDADCRQLCPRTLSAAMRYAEDHSLDMLSVLPELEMRGFWENVVQPVCSGVMMIWFPPDKVNDPARPNAYANGAFILMRRSTYQAIGTHAAARDKLMEDMHLASLVKQAGAKLRVVRSRGLYTVRMYTSLGEILRGWSRIFFGTFGTLPRLTVSLLMMLLMGLLPYASAIAGLTAAAVGGSPWWLAAGMMGLAAIAMQLSVVARFYAIAGARANLAWTYPIGCGVVTLALLMAAGKHRPGAAVVWRNTRYTKRPGG
ncbi:MAG: glycosyltransferase family 2 protein [Phycisphaerae bacterium]|nr:glycosyltransferase family 2 protein [Phycisphaerae bacterium]